MGRNTLASDPGDPLTLAIAPPADETAQDRAARLRREAEAKKVSDEIDRQLEADGAALRKRRKPVKVLLLGQSESGKSTTLKNFQLSCSPKTWEEERSSWRAVIQLNLSRSVNVIVDALSQEASMLAPFEQVGEGAEPLHYTIRRQKSSFPVGPKHIELIARLQPLRKVQKELERRLGSGATEEPPSPVDGPNARRNQEFFVRSNSGWKAAIDKFRPRLSTGSRMSDSERDDGVTRVLADCQEEVRRLWDDTTVRDMVRRRRIRLEDSAEFFLSRVERVAKREYTPSDNDVVRARLRTVGVQEHRIVIESGIEAGRELLMYDVGGTRSSRAAWSAYFDDVNAIIFLAPINCFDEKLVEDHRVNRLEDSFILWTAVCSNKLLSQAQLILFLNKCDLLEKKLKNGVRVVDYLPSFADRPNDKATVTKYLRQKFTDISRQHSPAPRTVHVHLTSVVGHRDDRSDSWCSARGNSAGAFATIGPDMSNFYSPGTRSEFIFLPASRSVRGTES